jgi:hypothetical protein
MAAGLFSLRSKKRAHSAVANFSQSILCKRSDLVVKNQGVASSPRRVSAKSFTEQLRLQSAQCAFPLVPQASQIADSFLKFSYDLTVKELGLGVQCQPSDRSVSGLDA